MSETFSKKKIGSEFGNPIDLLLGAGLSMTEAGTFGLPFEIWKTRSGAYPKESAVQSAKSIYASGGPKAFWRGYSAKMMEAGSKGAVLLFAKEMTIDGCQTFGVANRGTALAGGIGGAIGGVAQTAVMAPFTLVVTYKMENPNQKIGTYGVLSKVGLRKAYASALPIALRQSSNWALRQGFADVVTAKYHEKKGSPLNYGEKILCGIVGGFLSCINQPFEVLRIKVQSAQSRGDVAHSTTGSAAKLIYREAGVLGFFAALIPRMALAAWQTLFMVTFADMAKKTLSPPTAK